MRHLCANVLFVNLSPVTPVIKVKGLKINHKKMSPVFPPPLVFVRLGLRMSLSELYTHFFRLLYDVAFPLIWLIPLLLAPPHDSSVIRSCLSFRARHTLHHVTLTKREWRSICSHVLQRQREKCDKEQNRYTETPPRQNSVHWFGNRCKNMQKRKEKNPQQILASLSH